MAEAEASPLERGGASAGCDVSSAAATDFDLPASPLFCALPARRSSSARHPADMLTEVHTTPTLALLLRGIDSPRPWMPLRWCPRLSWRPGAILRTGFAGKADNFLPPAAASPGPWQPRGDETSSQMGRKEPNLKAPMLLRGELGACGAGSCGGFRGILGLPVSRADIGLLGERTPAAPPSPVTATAGAELRRPAPPFAGTCRTPAALPRLQPEAGASQILSMALCDFTSSAACSIFAAAGADAACKPFAAADTDGTAEALRDSASMQKTSS